MFAQNHYVPVLKARQKEFKAIQLLDPAVMNNMTPLFELMPPSTDDEQELIDMVEQFCSRTLSALGTTKLFFLDLLWINHSLTVNGKSVIEWVFDRLRVFGLQAVPVTSPSRSFIYQNAVKNVLQVDKKGLCVRLQDQDLNAISSTQSYVNLLGETEATTDILIDLGTITDKQANLVAASVISHLFALPNVTAWRNIILSASAYPTSGSTPGKLTTFKRTEWEVWNTLYTQRTKLPRLPLYGDYCVDPPALPAPFDPTKMSLGASIRYTADSSYLIFKGGAIKKYGSKQYYTLAQDVVTHTSYKGSSFSWGDQQIDDYAHRIPPNGGGAAGWRAISYNHHLTLVTDQLSNLSWP